MEKEQGRPYEPAEEKDKYGAKCARLLALSRDPEFTAVALPLLPFDPVDAYAYLAQDGAAVPLDGSVGHTAQRELAAGYAAFLRDRRPDLAEELHAVCGDAPWIVRSSGDEDHEENVNAGGYESLVCAGPEALYSTVAAVVFSGYGEHAIAQQRLTDPSYRPAPIAAFVQPLVDVAASAEGPPVAASETPLPAPADVAALAGLLVRLHERFAMPRLDSEWVLETDAGTVSVTGLTELTSDDRLVGQLSLGFGFGTAQKSGDGGNSLAWLTGVPGTVLWQGEMLRRVETARSTLVQVRPATAFDPEPSLDALTEKSRDAWRAACLSAPVDILVPPRRVRATSFLTSVRLEDAWSRYLLMQPEQRERLGHVLVERGTPAEHAAVMFRQHGVAVLRGRPEDLPETASYALADPWTQECHFGTGRPPEVEVETRRMSAVPQGCRLLFTRADGEEAAAAVLVDGVPPGPTLMPGASGLYDLPHVPPRVRDRIVANSFRPAPEVFVRDGAEVASPAFTARLAEALLARGVPADRVTELVRDTADGYTRGLRAARADSFGVPAVLPRCARSVPPGALGAAIAGAVDVRLPVVLARLEDAVALSDTALAEVLPRVLALAGTAGGPHVGPGREAALALIGAVESLTVAMTVLDVYDTPERDEVIGRAVAALPVDDPVRTEELCRFAARSSAPPTEIHHLLEMAAAEPDFAVRCLALERRRVDLSAADAGDAARCGHALNEAFRAYAGAGAWHDGGAGTAQDSGGGARAPEGSPVLLDLVRSDLIEAYDSTLKRLLLEVVSRPDQAAYRAYLDVLDAWLSAAAGYDLSPAEERSVAGFGRWVREWRGRPVPENFVLDEELTWSRLLELSAAGEPLAGGHGPDHPHQLHNALHQWLLHRTARYPVERAPSVVRELQRLSDRFGPGGNKLLRFTRNAFELDVPLGIHKASLLFRPDRVEGEWTEPPDVTEADSGRLTGLMILLERCESWFPELEFRGERVRMAGTWTLRVEARQANGERFTPAGMRLALGVFRTLFDGSYDFSYVPVDEVAGLDGAFLGPEWKRIFRALVDYRLVYEDAELFETLETLPLGTAIGMLCLDGHIRSEVARASAAGPEGAVARLDAAWRRLAGITDPADWIAGYNAVQQLALLVAARFPEAGVAALCAADQPGWADVLASALLPRADVRDAAVRAFSGRPEGDSLLLGRAPWLALSEENAAEVARRVMAAPGAYRRCKQLLVHRYADVLAGAGVLEELVAGLEVVPYGAGPRQEKLLAAAADGRLRRDIRVKPGVGGARPVAPGGVG